MAVTDLTGAKWNTGTSWEDFVTGEETLLLAINNVVLTPGIKAIQVDWDDVIGREIMTNPADPGYYRVYYRKTGIDPYVTFATTTPYGSPSLLVTGLDASEEYEVKVIAKTGDSGLWGPYSAVETASTVIGVIAGFTATPGEEEVVLDWDATGLPDVRYWIQRRVTDPQGSPVYITTYLNANTFTDTTGDVGESYEYRVLPRSPSGTGGAPDPDGEWGVWSTYIEGTSLSTLVLGATTYTAADIAAWTTGSEYTALNNRMSSGPRDGYTIEDYGTEIVAGDLDNLKGISNQIKSFAVLWEGGGRTNDTYLGYCTSWLDGMKDVTSWTGQTGEVNLQSAWILMNAVQVAQIIGYSDPNFTQFLLDRVSSNGLYPSTTQCLDWDSNGNWLLSFAVARMHIASFTGIGWDDAWDYYVWHISRCIAVTEHDEPGLDTLPAKTTWPARKTATPVWDASVMSGNWNNDIVHDIGSGQYPLQYSNETNGEWEYAGNFSDGTHCEAKRDAGYEHFNTILTAMGCLVALNVGQTIPQHVDERCRYLATYACRRLWPLENTGATPNDPIWQNGTSDAVRRRGWPILARYFNVRNVAPPSELDSLVATTEALSQKEGALFMSAPEYADGTLVP